MRFMKTPVKVFLMTEWDLAVRSSGDFYEHWCWRIAGDWGMFAQQWPQVARIVSAKDIQDESRLMCQVSLEPQLTW